MSVLNFKEIPLPTEGGDRDQFELFARDFLEYLGFKVITGPDRGADGGRDLIMEENRTGVAGQTKIRWLVSCKHKAHGGTSVTPQDESDIHDRVNTHGCQGFLGFYSTLPSAGLAAKLNAPTLPFEVQVFDRGRIEAALLESPVGITMARRYMPVSTESWAREHPSPAKLFSEDPKLFCAHCGKNLLDPKPSGIIVIWQSYKEDYSDRLVEKVYWCCKRSCDRALTAQHYRQGLIDGWEDIPDLVAPLGYLRWFMGIINELHSRRKYSSDALESMKTFLLNVFPFIAREMTEAENEQIQRLIEMPSEIGGWGN